MLFALVMMAALEALDLRVEPVPVPIRLEDERYS